MDWRKIKEHWPHYRSAAQRTWPKLDEDALEQIGGDRTLLVEKLLECCGYEKEEATLAVDRWADALTGEGKAQEARS